MQLMFMAPALLHPGCSNHSAPDVEHHRLSQTVTLWHCLAGEPSRAFLSPCSQLQVHVRLQKTYTAVPHLKITEGGFEVLVQDGPSRCRRCCSPAPKISRRKLGSSRRGREPRMSSPLACLWQIVASERTAWSQCWLYRRSKRCVWSEAHIVSPSELT